MNRRERKRLAALARQKEARTRESNGKTIHKDMFSLAMSANHPSLQPPPKSLPPQVEVADSVIRYVQFTCQADTGDSTRWNSKGYSYRWEMAKDPTGDVLTDENLLPIIHCFRISSNGEHEIRSDTVRFDATGLVANGPKIFREASKLMGHTHDVMSKVQPSARPEPAPESSPDPAPEPIPEPAPEADSSPPGQWQDMPPLSLGSEDEIRSLATMLRIGLASAYAFGFDPNGKVIGNAVNVCKKVEESLGVSILPGELREMGGK